MQLAHIRVKDIDTRPTVACWWSSVDQVSVDMSTERRPTCRSRVERGVDRYYRSTLDRGCTHDPVIQYRLKGVEKQPHEMCLIGPLVLDTMGRINININTTHNNRSLSSNPSPCKCTNVST